MEKMWRFPPTNLDEEISPSFKAIRAFAGAHAVRILQDELPEAFKAAAGPNG